SEVGRDVGKQPRPEGPRPRERQVHSAPHPEEAADNEASDEESNPRGKCPLELVNGIERSDHDGSYGWPHVNGSFGSPSLTRIQEDVTRIQPSVRPSLRCREADERAVLCEGRFRGLRRSASPCSDRTAREGSGPVARRATPLPSRKRPSCRSDRGLPSRGRTRARGRNRTCSPCCR